uniref:AAA_23 domain-containing protein n=1 Tax=Gongylonema pulchrum TaxID=637853 RepID=A0A183EB86_9BILA
LKYVTTGELPKGNLQAFIHDIRLCDKARVDASVKLKFRDIRGRCCVVTRRMMQFKGAKGKLSNKSEESTIAIENEHGEWKSLSSKVIDCKKEILNLLGLPAAILDYVVFCHQEESSWPLDEPKKLKERFDEIFQVTGYVKAIDVLKKELKENQQELKIIDNKLPFLVRQFEEKGKLHSEYSGLKDEVLKTEEEVTRSQNVLKELTVEKEKKVAELEQAETLQKKHDMIEAERQIFLDQIKCCSLPVYAGGIEELKREIDQVHEHDDLVQQLSRLINKYRQDVDNFNVH